MSDPTLTDLAGQVERIIKLLQPAADKLAADAVVARPPDAIDRELARPPRRTATVDLSNAPEVLAFRRAADADALTNSLLSQALGVVEQFLPLLIAAL
jgi:hypothetical protein